MNQLEIKDKPEKTWKPIEPNIWKPENDGDSIQGKYLHKHDGDKEAEISTRYYLEYENNTIMVWGSAVLDDRMNLINIGDFIKIVYKGKVKNKKGREVKIYKVMKLE